MNLSNEFHPAPKPAKQRKDKLKTPDGEKLQVVEVVESKPKEFSYIVFVEK